MNSFPTRAAVDLRESSRVVVGRHAGWVATLFTSDGGLLLGPALCVESGVTVRPYFRPHGKQLLPPEMNLSLSFIYYITAMPTDWRLVGLNHV